MTKKTLGRRANSERPIGSRKPLDRLIARPIRSEKQVQRLGALLEVEVKAGRVSKTRARAMRRVAELIREVVALEKSAGGNSSGFSVNRLPTAKSRRTSGTKQRRPKR